MFNKILIANRGEIACRIIKTARRLGIETVAVYSAADRDGLHTKLADSAFYIGEPLAANSYLNIERIIEVAKKAGVQAIHPGYGFLSENPEFARACKNADIIFIGPGVKAMEAMASKKLAKQLLENTNVPLTPGYHGNDQRDETLLLQACLIGFPVLLKAAAGGGGKGMRAVLSEAEFSSALAGARREAKASFGDETMLVEKLITHPRHVEIQIMADNQGQVVHLFERDCSIQRRHQKIIEEAPAPNLSQSTRNALATAAITVAKAINYRGAGTVEFLVDKDEQFYFMEMNTRLQVEHPVTEMITGRDLVEWQLRIAANEPLPCAQNEITARGHAFECRIYAEDPGAGFIPSIGSIEFLREPVNEGVRIDSGIEESSKITMHYDPMMAKLITWGKSRAQALQKMQQALAHYYLRGVKTNLPFLQAIFHHPEFAQAAISTDFLNNETISLPSVDKQQAAFLAASLEYLLLQETNDSNLLRRDAFAWQMHGKSQWRTDYLIGGEKVQVTNVPVTNNQLKLQFENQSVTLQVQKNNEWLYFDDGEKKQKVLAEILVDGYIFYMAAGPVKVQRFDWQAQTAKSSTDAQLTAPMPATVVAILQNKGSQIHAGDKLMILEAMKMEHTIIAPQSGQLMDIFYQVGDQVNEGAELAAIHPIAEETQ